MSIEWAVFISIVSTTVGVTTIYLLVDYFRDQNKRTSELEERMNYYNGATKRGKDHMSWNMRHATDDISTRIFQLAHNNKVNSALIETLFAEVEMMRKGIYDPDKPERDYKAKMEDNL